VTNLGIIHLNVGKIMHPRKERMKKKPTWCKKKEEMGLIQAKHNSKLVAKEFLQQHGIDYTELFAPVARMKTMRLVMIVASSKNSKISQMDVKPAFLNDIRGRGLHFTTTRI